MPLMKCKTHLELNWTKIYIMCNNDNNAECKITNTKLCVPVVTLSNEDNVKLSKELFTGIGTRRK